MDPVDRHVFSRKLICSPLCIPALVSFPKGVAIMPAQRAFVNVFAVSRVVVEGVTSPTGCYANAGVGSDCVVTSLGAASLVVRICSHTIMRIEILTFSPRNILKGRTD